MPATPSSAPGISSRKPAANRGFLLNLADPLPWLFLLLALAPVGACGIVAPDPQGEAAPNPGDIKILFIGASYLAVNDLPGIFEGFALAAGKEVFVARAVRSGYYLDFFAQDPVTAHAIQDQEWDFVVLSGGCQTAAYPDTHHLIRNDWGRHHPFPPLEELGRKVLENHGESVVVVILPWAFEDGMTWIANQTDDYFAMQERIRGNVVEWADSLGMAVAPVGMAWKRVLEEGAPQHYLHMSDWNHPSPRGSFLAAATVFSTLFQEASTELEFRWTLNQADAEALRRVASETVLDSLSVWNLPR